MAPPLERRRNCGDRRHRSGFMTKSRADRKVDSWVNYSGMRQRIRNPHHGLRLVLTDTISIAGSAACRKRCCRLTAESAEDWGLGLRADRCWSRLARIFSCRTKSIEALPWCRTERGICRYTRAVSKRGYARAKFRALGGVFCITLIFRMFRIPHRLRRAPARTCTDRV